MLKQAAVAFFLVLASAGTGFADDATPAPPPSTSATLDALRADPHVQKAMEFMDASGSKAALTQRFDLVMGILFDQARKAHPDVPQANWDIALKVIREEFQANSDELLLMSAKLYTQHFSDAELDELIAFYKSDVGVKYLRERSNLVAEETELGKAWGEKLAPEIADRIGKLIKSQTKTMEQKT
jgi:hypothetical protein